MFDWCSKGNIDCPFSVEGIHCGLGKGESLIEDIVSCDGKHPKYTNKFLGRLTWENKNATEKQKAESVRDTSALAVFQWQQTK